MRLILIILIAGTSCAKLPPQKTPTTHVSLDAALNQAQMSYLKGCVIAFKSLKLSPSFEECREKSLAHRLELQQMMDYNVE